MVSLTIFFAILAIIIFLYILHKKTDRYAGLRLPPGPPGWPIFGNLLQVTLSGKQFMHYVQDLRKIYGPIFTLRMGSRTLVIICDARIAHEALIEKPLEFASRPRENQTRRVFSCDKFTINSVVYGPEWRSLRRNMVSGMLNTSRLKDFRGIRDYAMDRLIERISTETKENDGVVSVLKNARFAMFCILLSMCFGVDLDEDTIVKVDETLKKVLMVLLPRIDDFLPILSPLFGKQWRAAMDVRKEQIEVITPLIEKRRELLASGQVINSDNVAPFSYLDSLFDLKIEGRKSSPSNAELVSLCSELLNGGTDTTATVIEWGIARLIENPAAQKRLYDEIVATVGDRKVNEKDTENMVYLQAFVKELLRRHPPTYFSLTHAAVNPGSKLSGYDIPTDANLDIFIPAISDDPTLWNDPNAFNPDRFITGGEDCDIKGIPLMRMIPFGAGRRICPGMAMAMTHITLMLARMVQEFEWSKEGKSEEPIDFGEKLEFTIVMNKTLKSSVLRRN